MPVITCERCKIKIADSAGPVPSPMRKYKVVCATCARVLEEELKLSRNHSLSDTEVRSAAEAIKKAFRKKKR